MAIGNVELDDDDPDISDYAPAMWLSRDGCRWNALRDARPVQAADELYEVAVHDGALVVLGGIRTDVQTNKGDLMKIHSWVLPNAAGRLE